MTPLFATSLLGAGSSLLSKGLDQVLGNKSQKKNHADWQAQLEQARQNLPGAGTNPPSADELFGKIDTDGSGSLSREEVSSFVTQQQQAIQSALLNLQALSQGGQGAQHAHRHGSHGAERGSRMFDRIDGDGNGSISKDELSAFLSDMAKQLTQSAGQTQSTSQTTTGDTGAVTSSSSSTSTSSSGA